MAAVQFVLIAVLFLSCGTNGKTVRTPCLQSNLFRCDNGDCIYKHKWCDNSKDCSDNSDESYCHKYPLHPSSQKRGIECNDNIHFQCENGFMCIPREGYCDGYSSCPDRSDEKGCPCEDLIEEQGNLEYEAFISQYRTHHKCWKIAVGEGHYVDLNITADLYSRECTFGNVTVFKATEDDAEKLRDSYDVLCYINSHQAKSYTLHEDTVIRYRSNFYRDVYRARDLIHIAYKKVDSLCQEPDAFRCTENSCISSEKQCDGITDCRNGRDEQNCDYGVFSTAYLETNRKKAVEWMGKQRNEDWGWKENTHKAVVALSLAGGIGLNVSNKEHDLIAKQLELEVFTFLLRRKSGEKSSTTELAAFINALLVICHDPRKFYGYDLVTALKEDLEIGREYTPPFLYLTLCNAKEPISEDAVNFLLNILQNSPDHGFVLEIQALTIMALTCAVNNNNQYAHLKQNVSEALDSLKTEQMDDGSFGNEYTTALVLQAMIANNQEKTKNWNSKAAVKFLRQKQEADGSFGDFLTTYLVLPALSVKSLLDVGKINCTEDLKRPRDGGIVSDIKSRLGGKIVVKYSLFIGDEKDQIHPIILRIHESITVLELMALAADIDPKYKFKTHQMKKKTYVYEISNIPNDPESNKFWFLYQGIENGTKPILEQSPDRVQVHEKDHIIMWYKTLNFI